MIRFRCHSCGRAIKTPDEAAGKTGKCKCGERVYVPTPNQFDQAMEDRPAPRQESGRQALPAPRQELGPQIRWHPDPAPHPSPHRQAQKAPNGDLIFCYACRRSVADNSQTCPKCGAVHTPEGREKGRQLKKQANIGAAVLVCALALPVVIFCLVWLVGILSSKSSSPPVEQRVPMRWDMDKLNQDAGEVVRDPSKTIIVPFDGSQPHIVPNPGAP